MQSPAFVRDKPGLLSVYPVEQGTHRCATGATLMRIMEEEMQDH